MATLIANVKKSSADSNGMTSAAIDTTGADIIFFAVANIASFGDPTVSDSKSNSWTKVRATSDADATGQISIWYSQAPTVGTGHTFTVAGSALYPNICVAAFSGSLATPLDQNNGANSGAGSVTTQQPGSVTPGTDNQVIITASEFNAGTAETIDLGYTLTDTSAPVGGAAFGCSMAYLVQTSAAATNPTWTLTSSKTASSIGTFKFSAPPAATTTNLDYADFI